MVHHIFEGEFFPFKRITLKKLDNVEIVYFKDILASCTRFCTCYALFEWFFERWLRIQNCFGPALGEWSRGLAHLSSPCVGEGGRP